MPAVDRGNIPNAIRILNANEGTAAEIDREEPIIIRGAFEAAKTRCAVGIDVLEKSWLEQSLREPSMDGQDAEYLSDPKDDTERVSEILGQLDLPRGILQLGPAHVCRFYLGPAGSGTVPRMRSHAVNALVRGRKRWAVYIGRDALEHELLVLRESGDRDGGPSQVAPWFATEWPKLRVRGIRVWEFTQDPGDVVFIPASFLHASFNLEPVAGFTAEFPSATTTHEQEPWSAKYERLLSANCMSSPFMEASARRLLPYMKTHGLGHAVLELGPNLHPLVTPDTFNGRIVYLEISDPCIEFLRDTFGDSVDVVKFNLHRAWDTGDNLLKAHLAACLHRSSPIPLSFDSLIASQIVNYVDFRKLLQACVELLSVGGLLFFNNIMNHGGASLFHPRRPQTMEEFLESAVEIGFDPIEVAAEPAGPTRIRHLAVLRRRTTR